MFGHHEMNLRWSSKLTHPNKIISDRYRKRRKRFGLISNLIAAIYNMELGE